MINRITVYLTLTLLIMSIVPMFGAAFFIEDILNSQAAIYKAPSINKALENSQLNLKKLAKLDSPNEPDYREQFEQLQDLKLIYGDDLVFNGALQATLRKYFFLGFGVILFASLVLGLGLSRLIDKSFKILLKDYEKVRERSRYLENLSGWQEIAKSLAH
ncbi:MAG: hypothetical protein ACXWQE_04240 [Bdellovibrionales bacterium]